MKIFEGQNILNFVEEYPNDDSCKAYLAQLKWEKGFSCRKCSHDQGCLKLGYKYECYGCSHVESSTANTLFHKVKFGLRKAFCIVFEMSTSSRSLASTQVAVRYGISQPTAWYFMQKVRIATKSSQQYKLTDLVHVDEFCIGGKETGKQGRSYDSKKKKAVIAVELTQKHQVKRAYIKGIDDYNRKKRGLNPRNSELISWCGTYINYVMKKSGYKTFSTAFRAKDWTKYGKKVSIPIYGAIGVMTRPKGGHVSFVMGVDNVKNPKYVYMLGGNQWGYSNNIPWGTKTTKNGKSYIKSVLYPSRYNLSDWNLGFYVPYSYCQINCKMKKYTGRYIISASDGN